MIKEIPWPFAPPKRKGVAKHHRHVAIPMRPTKEKAVEEAIDICERAGVTYWCSGATLPREEYLTRLEESQFVLSTAQQETFGYAVLEGLALGCFPVVPDRLSYPELYPNHCRYKTIKDAVEILSGPELPLPVFPFERHQPGNVVGEILAGLK
jgi:glycosyltransferase involved in cell wall biosynthesis